MSKSAKSTEKLIPLYIKSFYGKAKMIKDGNITRL